MGSMRSPEHAGLTTFAHGFHPCGDPEKMYLPRQCEVYNDGHSFIGDHGNRPFACRHFWKEQKVGALKGPAGGSLRERKKCSETAVLQKERVQKKLPHLQRCIKNQSACCRLLFKVPWQPKEDSLLEAYFHNYMLTTQHRTRFDEKGRQDKEITVTLKQTTGQYVRGE